MSTAWFSFLKTRDERKPVSRICPVIVCMLHVSGVFMPRYTVKWYHNVCL